MYVCMYVCMYVLYVCMYWVYRYVMYVCVCVCVCVEGWGSIPTITVQLQFRRPSCHGLVPPFSCVSLFLQAEDRNCRHMLTIINHRVITHTHTHTHTHTTPEHYLHLITRKRQLSGSTRARWVAALTPRPLSATDTEWHWFMQRVTVGFIIEQYSLFAILPLRSRSVSFWKVLNALHSSAKSEPSSPVKGKWATMN